MRRLWARLVRWHERSRERFINDKLYGPATFTWVDPEMVGPLMDALRRGSVATTTRFPDDEPNEKFGNS